MKPGEAKKKLESLEYSAKPGELFSMACGDFMKYIGLMGGAVSLLKDERDYVAAGFSGLIYFLGSAIKNRWQENVLNNKFSILEKKSIARETKDYGDMSVDI